jgi:TetR/AcrR family transcriptional regulator, acrAB operon repressor
MAAAVDSFARLGYQGTSIDRIAREVGVTKGAVYYHFRDKEELLFAAVQDRIGGFERDVLRTIPNSDDAITALRRVVDSCFFHATVSNHRRFIITLMVEALDTHPGLSAQFGKVMARMRAFLSDIIRRGQQRQELRSGVDAETAASTFMAGIMGAEILHYQSPGEVDLRLVLDALIDQVIAWLGLPESPQPRSEGDS